MNIDPKFVRLYPNAEDVFADQVESYSQHLLPLVSVNLQGVGGPDIWIHCVHPAEVADGAIGDQTTEFWTDGTRDNMISFDVVAGKYKLQGTLDYFYLHSQKDKEFIKTMQKFNDEFLEEFAAQKAKGVSLDDAFVEFSDDMNVVAEPAFIVDGYNFGCNVWIAVHYDPEDKVATMDYLFD